MKKKILISCISLFIAFFLLNDKARSALSDIFSLQGGGTLNNIDVFRITSTGDLYLTDSSSYNALIADSTTGALTIRSGSIAMHNGSGATTAVTTGLSQGLTYKATLGGASAAVEGSALCALAPSASSILVQVCAATDNLLSFVGVAAAAASVGSTVDFYTAGSFALARTTGTVNVGAALMTSSDAAGHFEATTFSSHNVVGVALTTGTAAGGLTKVVLR